MNMRHLSLLALAVAMPWHGDATAASAQAIMPPPGLYRIDLEATQTRADVKAKVQVKRDGATGTQHVHGSNLGGTYDWNDPGSGPQTRCIKTSSPDVGYAMEAAALAACPNQTEKVIGTNILVHTSQCPDTTMTTRYTKIDGQTWDVETRVDKVNKPGPPDIGGMQTSLAMMAKSAPTQAQRDKATKLLASLPAEQAKINQQYADQLAKLEAAAAHTKDPASKALFQKRIADMQQQAVPGGPPLPVNESMVVKEHWTRIANFCGPNGGPQP